MSLSATEAARRMLDTTGAGGRAACMVVAHGPLAGCRLLAVRTIDGTEEVLGSLGTDAVDAAALDTMRQALDTPAGSDGLRTVTSGGKELEVYLEARGPARELVIVGAGHIAQPLSRMGVGLGLRVTVLDDRPDFATQERFPEAHRLVRVDFSDPFRDVSIHPGSHVLLVTRGHKYDYECLVRILRMDQPPAYLGMIGSRRRVRATFVQLLEEGVSRERLDEIYAPVGLDVKAETPEEIAVAVAAELVKVRRGGTGASLRDVERIAERFFTDTKAEDRE